ncbi:hypothetical protein IL306_009021 [Fusarium sp. DS 682]|nr:hypothetical protein IL306_009021 [Fusarium sp. DS 682]
MSWNRPSLADTGFFYDENLRNEVRYPFPPHVKSLEQAMLDFTCQELDLPTKKDLNIQREANRLANGGFSEDRWVDFFRDFFFSPLLRHASVSGGRSRISSRCQYYYDSIVFDTDALWGTFDKNNEGSTLLSTPKPDLVFYLPMYHLDSRIPTITDHEAQEWHKASTPSLVESFSWSTLKELRGRGLLATPFNVLDKEEPQEQDLSCYPWLIVEYKKSKRTAAELKRLEEVAYCQAANASGCAVKLNRNAARYAVELVGDAQIPPVASVTTVGPQVKVWITFFARSFMAYRWDDEDNQQYQRNKEGYMMQCIWTGDMTEPQDILKFRLILENTYTWAKRVFKPLIATYIDQWRFACSVIPGVVKTKMARRQEGMELSRCAIQFILRSLDSRPRLESDDDVYFGAALRLADLCDTFVRSMDRMIEEELKSSSLDNRASSSSKGSRRRARTPSEQSRKSMQATEINPDELKQHGYVDSQPRQSGSTDSVDSTPQSAPRRSPRLRPQSKPRPSHDTSSTVETVSSYLRATMAAGAHKRRQSQSKFLAPPIEIELASNSASGDSEFSDIRTAEENSDTVEDEDISHAIL